MSCGTFPSTCSIDPNPNNQTKINHIGLKFNKNKRYKAFKFIRLQKKDIYRSALKSTISGASISLT